MSKYVVSREKVCVGQLIYNDKTDAKAKEDSIVKGGKICRGMLFEVNEQGFAQDLIYTTPTNYTIEGITGASITNSSFVIVNYVNLSDFLRFIKYGEELTQYNLYLIFKNLIVRDIYLEKHKSLFGWRKAINRNEYIVVPNSKLPMEMYEKLKWISSFENGAPSELEPEYKKIKQILTR